MSPRKRPDPIDGPAAADPATKKTTGPRPGTAPSTKKEKPAPAPKPPTVPVWDHIRKNDLREKGNRRFIK